MARLASLPTASLLALAAAGCGDDGLRVRGTFADAEAPLRVWAAEAEREAAVEDGGFAFDDLAPGPVTLVLRGEGRDVGRIELRDLVSEATVEMEGLRIELASGRAFPRSVRLRGAEMVRINGVRYAPPDALPAEVAADGVVLAVSHAEGAMLFRPAGGALPDLRVVFGAYAVDASRAVREIRAGDSARVEGTTQDGYVIASRIAPPGSLAPAADSPSGDAPAARAPSSGDGGAATAAVPAAASAAGAARSTVRQGPPGRAGPPGRGRGGGRGQAKKPKKG